MTAILQKSNVSAAVSSSLLQTWKISIGLPTIFRGRHVFEKKLESCEITKDRGLGFSHCCQTPRAQAQSSVAAGLDLIPAGRPILSIGCRFLLDVLQVFLGVFQVIQVVRCQLLEDDF